MSTQTMSRILVTVMVAPLLAVAIYWLVSGAPIFGFVMLLGVAIFYYWIWRPQPAVKKAS
jgi:hypothetical protein